MSLSRRHSKGEHRRRRVEINGRRAIVVRDMPGQGNDYAGPFRERWGSVSPELERDYNSAAVCRRGHAETMAIEFRARDVTPGSGRGVGGGLVAAGAKVHGTVTSAGEIVVIDCGAEVLVSRETLPDANPGDDVSFVVAEEGKAYLIPTR